MPGQPEGKSATESVMDRIDEEHRRDVFIRRVAKIAWGVTVVIVLILVALTTVQMVNMAPLLRFQAGGGPAIAAILGLAMPLVFVLGALSVLVATLCTIGMFLRMRTASLQEIQLRLAALEQILMRDENDDANSGARRPTV